VFEFIDTTGIAATLRERIDAQMQQYGEIVKVQGPESLEALRALHATGRLLLDNKEPRLALPVFDHVLEHVRLHDGPPAHRLAEVCASNAVSAAIDAGDSPEALRRLRQRFAANPADADEAAALLDSQQLAVVHIREGNPADAIAILEYVLPQLERTLGDNVLDAYRAHANLATALLLDGRKDEAVPHLLMAQGGFFDLLGPGDPFTIQATLQLVDVLIKGQEYVDAEQMVVRTLLSAETDLGPDHPLTVTLFLKSALCAAQQQRIEAVVSYTESAWAGAQHLPEDHASLHDEAEHAWAMADSPRRVRLTPSLSLLTRDDGGFFVEFVRMSEGQVLDTFRRGLNPVTTQTLRDALDRSVVSWTMKSGSFRVEGDDDHLTLWLSGGGSMPDATVELDSKLAAQFRHVIGQRPDRSVFGNQGKAGKTPGRNDPCPCGSGLKYKKCCGA